MLNIIKKQNPTDNYYTDKKIRVKTKEALKKEFFNLCYLCESRDLRNLQIEHFYPKGEAFFPEKINDWNNLFLICGKCNTVRPKNINTKGEEVYNNCIDKVENLITLYYDKANEQVKIESSENTTKAKNTVKLLERIYNGKGSESTDYLELQKEIKNKIEHFKIALDSFNNMNNKLLKDNYKNIVIDFISKDYNLKSEVNYNRVAFVSFKRQIVKDKYPLFEQYFD